MARGESGDERDRRRQIDEREPGHGPGEEQRVVPQLRVGAARHHPPQVAEPRVGAHAVDAIGEAQPDVPSGALHRPGERDVVDDGVPDRVGDRGTVGSFGAQQHAAAGRGRRARALRRDPAERVQLGEEVHEGRDDEPLPHALHAQPRHQRDEVEPACTRRGHQLPQAVGLMRDVGVGEKQELGVTRACQADAVPHRPQLAGPARRRLARRVDRERQPAVAPGQLPGQRSGAVRAAVVDQEDLGAPRIVLRQQRGQALRKHGRLVPRGDDDTHRGPLRRGRARGQAQIRAPEEALPDQQPHPRGQ